MLLGVKVDGGMQVAWNIIRSTKYRILLVAPRHDIQSIEKGAWWHWNVWVGGLYSSSSSSYLQLLVVMGVTVKSWEWSKEWENRERREERGERQREWGEERENVRREEGECEAGRGRMWGRERENVRRGEGECEAGRDLYGSIWRMVRWILWHICVSEPRVNWLWSNS